jgi:undecaprenyl-diphosphatase
MDFLTASIYGIVQGLCEFLPVSSSGHLALLPAFIDVKDPGVFFDLLMHVGTALAVCIYYHRSIGQILTSFYRWMVSLLSFKKWKPAQHADYLMINMLVATFSSVILILVLKDHAEAVNRNYILIGFNLIIFGFVLWIVDLLVKRKVDDHFETKIDVKASVMIGIAQALAIFPGVSRAGITLTMSRGLGLSKTAAANFTFLLSLPIIFAGAAVKILEILKSGAEFPPLMVTVYALFLSGVVGILTIHFFIKLIKRISLFYFFLYRLILGLLVWKFLVGSF